MKAAGMPLSLRHALGGSAQVLDEGVAPGGGGVVVTGPDVGALF